MDALSSFVDIITGPFSVLIQIGVILAVALWLLWHNFDEGEK